MGVADSQRLTLDIYVPPEQVKDTVNIYSIPDQKRKLSLRFLSWFLLKKDIQTSTHDSIEDARHALLLYKLYEQFERDGRFEDVMEDIFAEGQKVVRPRPFADPNLTCRDSNRLKIGRHLLLPSRNLGHLIGNCIRRMPRIYPRSLYGTSRLVRGSILDLSLILVGEADMVR